MKIWKNKPSKIYSCGIFFLLSILSVYAKDIDTEIETNGLKSIFSIDTNFTMTALKNYGFGIGINYERKLTDFLSIKPGFGHMACFSDITVVTVNLQLSLYYYPLSNGLDKLYIGLGNGCDFIMYINEIPQDTAISLTPVMGWKWRVLPFLMVEPLLGWKFIIVKSNNYQSIDKYLNGGFQWGFNFKVFIHSK